MKRLQLASGIFLHLKEIVVGMIRQDPTPDLEPETLAVISDLMLAQAQEMVALKVINGQRYEYYYVGRRLKEFRNFYPIF